MSPVPVDPYPDFAPGALANGDQVDARFAALYAALNPAVGGIDAAMVKDAAITLAKLATPPRCKVSHSVNTGYNSGTAAMQPFNGEDFDTNGMHDTVTNPSRITIQSAATYLIGAHATFAASAAGTLRQMKIVRGGAGGATVAFDRRPPLGAGNVVPLSAMTVLPCGVGDFFEVEMLHDIGAGNALVVVADAAPDIFSPRFWAIAVGP